MLIPVMEAPLDENHTATNGEEFCFELKLPVVRHDANGRYPHDPAVPPAVREGRPPSFADPWRAGAPGALDITARGDRSQLRVGLCVAEHDEGVDRLHALTRWQHHQRIDV